MSFDQHSADDAITRLSSSTKLSRIERIAFLSIIGIVVAVDVTQLFVTRPSDPVDLSVSIASTLILAVFLWSPLIASFAMALIFVFAFAVGTEPQVLLTAALAVGLVLRFGRIALSVSYTAGFVIAVFVVALSDAGAAINPGMYLIVGTVSGAIGMALRLAFARGLRLESELEKSVEQERQAVLAERRWIAGELHDSIAHHLTVVSLHVQMLEDPQTSSDSQEAIRVAARKAMTDLRFVIELADDGPQSSSVQTGDLAAAIDEAQSEFEAAGHSVVREGDPRDERIPRAVEIVLARITRESATNILKYAGPGEVEIRLDVDDDVAHLTLRSPLPTTPRRELSSSRTGLTRMAERVVGASGEFTAGEVEGHWVVSARLPVV